MTGRSLSWNNTYLDPSQSFASARRNVTKCHKKKNPSSCYFLLCFATLEVLQHCALIFSTQISCSWCISLCHQGLVVTMHCAHSYGIGGFKTFHNFSICFMLISEGEREKKMPSPREWLTLWAKWCLCLRCCQSNVSSSSRQVDLSHYTMAPLIWKNRISSSGPHSNTYIYI